MTPVRLKPAALRSRVKYSTTEPLCGSRSAGLIHQKPADLIITVSINVYHVSISGFENQGVGSLNEKRAFYLNFDVDIKNPPSSKKVGIFYWGQEGGGGLIPQFPLLK